MTDQLKETNPFWEYSLTLYAREGVAPACLQLQDQHGVDVNLLLYACYAACCGLELGVSELAAMDARIAGWRSRAVQPLRRQRRELREREGAESLRQQVVRLELLAERAQQQQMWLTRVPTGEWVYLGPGEEQLHSNLAQLAAFYEIPALAVRDIEALAGVV